MKKSIALLSIASLLTVFSAQAQKAIPETKPQVIENKAVPTPVVTPVAPNALNDKDQNTKTIVPGSEFKPQPAPATQTKQNDSPKPVLPVARIAPVTPTTTTEKNPVKVN